MDAVVWFAGVQGAVIMALDDPEPFGSLVDTVAETDRERTELAGLAFRHEKKFAYVMTTGVEQLGTRLLEAGVDVLYFVDPVQDRIPLERAKDLFGGRMTIVGGTNAVSLASRNRERIREEVKRAVDVLGPTNRFILHPVDALFPDTPPESVEILIEAWRENR
jgi:uroporphyrinogen-III decarboxylase